MGLDVNVTCNALVEYLLLCCELTQRCNCRVLISYTISIFEAAVLPPSSSIPLVHNVNIRNK